MADSYQLAISIRMITFRRLGPFRWAILFGLLVLIGAAIWYGRPVGSGRFLTYRLPENQPLHLIAQNVASQFEGINKYPVRVPVTAQLALYPMLTQQSRKEIDEIFSIAPDSGVEAAQAIIRQQVPKLGPKIDFSKRSSKKSGLTPLLRAVLSVMLAYDAHMGIQMTDISNKPVLLFLPITYYDLRAYQYTGSGLEDKSYYAFCEEAERLREPKFVFSLPVVLARGFNPSFISALSEDQRALLLDFASIYIAEAYKGYRGRSGRKDQSYTEALIRNTLFLPYLASGGRILAFDETQLNQPDVRQNNMQRTWSSRGRCWSFFRGMRARYQRELTERVISKYFQLNHPELFSAITDAAENNEQAAPNIFQTIASSFENGSEIKEKTLTEYTEFIRLLADESAAISTAVDDAATSESAEPAQPSATAE